MASIRLLRNIQTTAISCRNASHTFFDDLPSHLSANLRAWSSPIVQLARAACRLTTGESCYVGIETEISPSMTMNTHEGPSKWRKAPPTRRFSILGSGFPTLHLQALSAPVKTLALMLAVLGSAYSPVLSTNYFFYDDYYQLARGKVPFLLVLPEYLGGYRPGFAVWLSVVTNANNTLLDSARVRLAGLVGLTILCYVLYAWSKRRGLGQIPAFCLSILVCTTPAFQSVMGYASSAVSTYCCVFSAVAAITVLEVWTSPRVSRLARGASIGIGALLIVVAMGTYQPPAMFCWVIVAVAWYAPKPPDWRASLKASCVFLGTFLLGVCGTFLLCKGLLSALNMSLSGRAALLTNPGDILAKLKWFALDVLPNSLARVPYGWSEHLLFLRVTEVLLLLLLTLLAPLLRKNDNVRWQLRILQMALAPVLLCLAYSPFLIIREKGYLTLYFTSLEPLLVVLFTAGSGYVWTSIARPLSVSARKTVGTTVLGLIALTSVVTCNRNMLQVYVVPNRVEYLYVKNVLTHADLKNVSHIHIVGHLNFSEVLSYSEFLVSVVLNELNPGHEIRITSSSDEIPPIIHEPIMNRNPDLLRPAYTMTPHGYYALRADITPAEREAVRRYFASLSDIYRKEGALVIDVGSLRGIVGMWRGML